MAADYKAIARRMFDEVLAGDMDALDEVVADDFVEHEAVPGMPPGKDGLRQWVTTFKAAFPDLRMEPLDMVAEGNKLAVRGRMSGTHQGELMGIPATGKAFETSFMDLLEFDADDKVVAHWGVTDVMAMMAQLGVAEAPGG